MELGLSISHVTRAISLENVCEYPLDPFFVDFMSAKPELELFFAHTLAYFYERKNIQAKSRGGTDFKAVHSLNLFLILAPAVVIYD